MVSTGLLIIIYVSFISLGLPDSLLGSAWPSMYTSLGAPIAFAGALSMITSCCTIVSSMFSGRIIIRFGTGPVTVVSVAATCAALLGMSFSASLWQMCLWSIPLGLGAGSVDVALNNYIALRYKARHMSWLHCFWGVGATLGPLIMSYHLAANGWAMGYRAIGLIQLSLVAVLILTLPLWKLAAKAAERDESKAAALSLRKILKLPGAGFALIAFFCYCAIETTAGLWGGSFLVFARGFTPEAAAKWMSLYYLGITLGRFLSGFVSFRLGNRQMIRFGMAVLGAGILVLLVPVPGLSVAGLFLMGLGCAPIYPSMLHETPVNFGSENSQALMGVQMASSYVGTTFVPPVFGFIAAEIGYNVLPVTLICLLGVMAFTAEQLKPCAKA